MRSVARFLFYTIVGGLCMLSIMLAGAWLFGEIRYIRVQASTPFVVVTVLVALLLASGRREK